MEVSQVHHTYNEGIHVNQHPNPEIAGKFNDMLSDEEKRVREFQEFVDSTPNLNHQYEQELSMVRGSFAAEGMEIAPIVILHPSDVARALEIGGNDPYSDDTRGIYTHGRSLVYANPVSLGLFGGDYILSNALHESGHSTLPADRTRLFSKDTLAVLGAHRARVDHHVSVTDISGFLKFSWSTGEAGKPSAHVRNKFYEEGFADLVRVHMEAKLGRQPSIIPGSLTQPNQDGGSVRYVGTGKTSPLIDKKNGCVSIPAEYLDCTMPPTGKKDRWHVLSSQPSIAAYGITLLDEQSPGLFADMVRARKDPKAFADVIKRIEAIQPGLHRKLSRLDYTARDFQTGLEMIAGATGQESKQVGSVGP